MQPKYVFSGDISMAALTGDKRFIFNYLEVFKPEVGDHVYPVGYEVLYLSRFIVGGHGCCSDKGSEYLSCPFTVFRQQAPVTAAHCQSVLFPYYGACDDLDLWDIPACQFLYYCQLLEVFLPEEGGQKAL